MGLVILLYLVLIESFSRREVSREDTPTYSHTLFFVLNRVLGDRSTVLSRRGFSHPWSRDRGDEHNFLAKKTLSRPESENLEVMPKKNPTEPNKVETGRDTYILFEH